MSVLVPRLDRFLFSSSNPFKVAIYRIITGIFISILFFNKLNDQVDQIFYFEAEWIYNLYENFILTPIYFAFCWVFILAFTIGLFPKIANGMLVVLLAPLLLVNIGHFRSFYLIYFSVLCFFFLYHSEYFSFHKRTHFTQKIKYGPIWPIRLIQILLSVLYFTNAAAKTTIPYLSGDVLIGLSQYPNFSYEFTDGYIPFLGLEIPVAMGAITVVLIEYFLSIGFWFKRSLYLTAFIGLSFHILISFYIDIHMLHLASIYLYFSFLLQMDK